MLVLILVDHVETLIFKKYKEKIPTPMQRSMFSAEVDEEATEHAEDVEEDRHIEDTSHLKKGNIASA